MLHQKRRTVIFGSRHEQMHVIRHQHVCVHGTGELEGKFAQMIEVKGVIYLVEKTGGAVVAALDQV